MKHFDYCQNNKGVTLIELIVAIVVISIALVGVLSVINYTTLHSADPVLRHQAIAIAEAYMEEISLKTILILIVMVKLIVVCSMMSMITMVS